VPTLTLDPTTALQRIEGFGGAFTDSVASVFAKLGAPLQERVLAIVALSLSLAVALPYGIVRLVLVEAGRVALAVAAPLLWIANTAVLLFWCRPAIRRYLR
jgi:hypothetical protein